MKEFILLSEPNLLYVVLGTMLLAAGAGVVGTFGVLRKQALVSDAVAHSVLPGICVAFLLAQTKNTAVLMLGAVVAGWLSLWLTNAIIRHSKTKPDAAIGVVLSLFFGLGILLLTAIQQSGNAAQSGLDKYLFGKAASLTQADVYVFGGVSVVLIGLVALFYQPLKIFCFDETYSQTRGLPVRFLEFLLSALTVLAVASGIQGVGVVLMASLLIAPSVVASFFSDNLKIILVVAGAVAAAAAWLGCLVSYLLPMMPTGPSIVLFLCFFVMMAVIFSPKKGVLYRAIAARRRAEKTVSENILKYFYHLSEQKNDDYVQLTNAELLQKFTAKELGAPLKNLLKKQLLMQINAEFYTPTPAGTTEAKRIARLHRLWEMYLYQKLRMPADHVHADAEELEHFITPELEAQLEYELNYPTTDPHNKPIPR